MDGDTLAFFFRRTSTCIDLAVAFSFPHPQGNLSLWGASVAQRNRETRGRAQGLFVSGLLCTPLVRHKQSKGNFQDGILSRWDPFNGFLSLRKLLWIGHARIPLFSLVSLAAPKSLGFPIQSQSLASKGSSFPALLLEPLTTLGLACWESHLDLARVYTRKASKMR